MDKHAPNTTCDNCGTRFFKPEAWKRKSKEHHFCSNPCRHEWRSIHWKGRIEPQLIPTPEGRRKGADKMRGPNNPAWKGGITFRKRKGRYPSSVKYVRCPPEFISMARKDGYVMEHRLIVAKREGRPLLRSEVVHHIDHDVTHNSDENLKLFTSNGEHKKAESGYFKEYYRRNPQRHTRTSRRSSR